MKINKLASGSSGNCYIINDDMMIECGLPINQIKKKSEFSLHKINACLISHEHSDHAQAVNDLLRLSVNIYMSAGTHNALQLAPNLHNIHIFDVNNMVSINNYNVLPFPVFHDHKFLPCADPLGFLIKTESEQLVYITDTSHVEYQFPNTTHFMIECNHSKELIDKSLEEGRIELSLYNRIRCTHFSLEQVIKFFKANDLSKCKEIHLIHISRGNGDPELFQKVIQELTGVPVYV
jgi:phosphoribosyl 1,2-cyclic phosphodiesterase